MESFQTFRNYKEMSQSEIERKVEEIISSARLENSENYYNDPNLEKDLLCKIKENVFHKLNYRGHISTFIYRDYNKEEIEISLDHPNIPNATFKVMVIFNL